GVGLAVRHSAAVQRLSGAVRRNESNPSMIGPISLGAKQMGARSAGNPHAACRGGGWKRGMVARPVGAPVLDPTREGGGVRFLSATRPVICFQYREDAEKVLQVLPKRFARYGLTLHPEKTRLVEFGRTALARAIRAGTKLDTFDFLGLTHKC